MDYPGMWLRIFITIFITIIFALLAMIYFCILAQRKIHRIRAAKDMADKRELPDLLHSSTEDGVTHDSNAQATNASAEVRKTLSALELRNARCSPPLRLPPELRNQIYDLVLTARDATHYFGGPDTSCTRKCNNQLGLLATCRQIYGETKALPFQLNMFLFRGLTLFRLVVDYFLPYQRSAFQRIKLFISHEDSTFVERMRAPGYRILVDLFPNVRVVHVVHRWSDYYHVRRKENGGLLASYRVPAAALRERGNLLGVLRVWSIGGGMEVEVVEKELWWEDEVRAWVRAQAQL